MRPAPACPNLPPHAGEGASNEFLRTPGRGPAHFGVAGRAVRAGGRRHRARGRPGCVGDDAFARRAGLLHPRHAGDHRPRFAVPHRQPARRRRTGGVADGRRAGAGKHHGLEPAPAAQRGRGNRDRLRRAGAEDLRARARSLHQRLRRRIFAVGRRGRGHPRRARPAQPRRAAGRHRARVQPHPQRRHAPEHPPDRRAVRHPHDRPDRAQDPVERPLRARPRRGRGTRRGVRGAGDRLHRPVLRAHDQGRRQSFARIAGRRQRGAVHAADAGPGRRAEEDRRPRRRRDAQRSRQRGRSEPHAVRRGPGPLVAVRDAPAAAQAHPGAGTALPRRGTGTVARQVVRLAAGRSGRGRDARPRRRGARACRMRCGN